MFTGSDSTRIGFPGGKALLGTAAVILCAAGALVFFAFDPGKVSLFPPCLFHRVTGLDCPGCGAQRALHQLLHGNFIAAFRLNAMFVISLPLFAWFGPRLITGAAKGTTPLNPKWLWVYLAAWVAFGVLRNLPFPIFAWFAA
jgi:hypothetical protein